MKLKFKREMACFCFTSVYFSTQNPSPLLYVCRYTEFLFFPFSSIGIVLIFLLSYVKARILRSQQLNLQFIVLYE